MTLHRSAIPENAYRTLMAQDQFDLVVANSLPRYAFSRMSEDMSSLRVPLALYVREQQGLTHLTISGLSPALVLANSMHLAEQVEAVGIKCVMIPSAVDCSTATAHSTRQAVVLVNPVEGNRLGLVFELARRRPDIPFVLQESWILDPPARNALETGVAALPNVEFRPAVPDPSQVYRDARILLATYPSGRPRVVLEAHHNGIPVLGLDQPALAEVVGDGGVLVRGDAPVLDWERALCRMWDDKVYYGQLRTRSEIMAASALTPEEVGDRFEAAINEISPE